jgi:hypothetical protein
MIQILLHNLKMDPLVSLHYYAPVCAIINLLFLPFAEGLEPFYQLKDLGVLVLVSNAAVAFLLNVAAVFLVGVASSLVLTLSGVFKVRLWLSFFLFLLASFNVGFDWRYLLVIMHCYLCCQSLFCFYCYILADGNTCRPQGACRSPYFLQESGFIVLVGQHQSSTFYVNDNLRQPLMLRSIFDHPSQALSTLPSLQ